MAFRYTAWLPVAASAKFELVTDTAIPADELQARFLAEAEAEGVICWQCSNGLETDFDVIESAAGEILIDEVEEG
jgi:hypothetical protein